jgi:cbb3-type cytochrome oxidase subunit 1
MAVGVLIAAQLVWPQLNFDTPWLTYNRLRPLHTNAVINAVIFAFGTSALFATSYYVVQRTCQTRLFGGPFVAFTFWGWLPFGLVYSTLTWAAVSGSALDGAVIMFSFGLGTLPTMLLVGMSAVRFQKWQRNEAFRQCGAIILIAYGLYTGYDAFMLLS